jgi:hypothetical protein
MAHTAEKPLDPLTLALYLPAGAAGTVVHDEDRPGIPVRYARDGDRLHVVVGPSPGELAVEIYGVAVVAARAGGQPLPLEAIPGGRRAWLDGRHGAEVDFRLA